MYGRLLEILYCERNFNVTSEPLPLDCVHISKHTARTSQKQFQQLLATVLRLPTFENVKQSPAPLFTRIFHHMAILERIEASTCS